MRDKNKLERRNDFDKEWNEYINYIFEDDNKFDIDNYEVEYSNSDRILEAFYSGCDVSKGYLSKRDKIKIKRYRREDCKR